jgi:hypothetical protein
MAPTKARKKRPRARTPDFLGIGAQKAGTTWLYANLRVHPGLWMPPVKELHYFDEIHIPKYREWIAPERARRCAFLLDKYKKRLPEERWSQRYLDRIADIANTAEGDEAYRRVFGLVGPLRFCGEITPEYSILPDEGVAHITRLAPDVRIILSLRDPIERSWSHARMLAEKMGATDAAKLKRFALGREATVRSDYPAVIDRWLRFVRSDQLLVVFMDDIVTRPLEVMTKICKHLGVECRESDFPKIGDLVHAGNPMNIPERIYSAMREHLSPVYRELAVRFPEIGAAWQAKHYS